MEHLMFYPYVLQIWISNNVVAISMYDYNSGNETKVFKEISRNPEYANWLKNYNNDILKPLYENKGWFVSETHANKDKYYNEFKREAERLIVSVDKLNS